MAKQSFGVRGLRWSDIFVPINYFSQTKFQYELIWVETLLFECGMNDYLNAGNFLVFKLFGFDILLKLVLGDRNLGHKSTI